MWVKDEINIPLQKLNWWQKVKNVKKKIIQSSSPTTMQTKQKQLQISRNRGRCRIKFIKNMNKMQSTLNSMVRDEGTNFGRQCLHHHYVLVYVERMRRKSCQITVKTRIIRKTTGASKGPEVTLRNIWGRKGFDVWCNSWETEIKIADVETLTLTHQRVAIGRTKKYKDEKYMQKTHTRTTVWMRRPAKKIHEAGNCELHKTKFKQLIADFCMTFQKIQWRGVHSHGIWREVVQTLSHNWKYYFVMNGISDSKLHTKASSRIRKERALGNREELTHTSDEWWKANQWTKSWWERSKRTWRKSEGFLSKWSWSDDFSVFLTF